MTTELQLVVVVVVAILVVIIIKIIIQFAALTPSTAPVQQNHYSINDLYVIIP